MPNNARRTLWLFNRVRRSVGVMTARIGGQVCFGVPVLTGVPLQVLGESAHRLTGPASVTGDLHILPTAEAPADREFRVCVANASARKLITIPATTASEGGHRY